MDLGVPKFTTYALVGAVVVTGFICLAVGYIYGLSVQLP